MSRLRFTIFSVLIDALLVNSAVVLAFLIRFLGHLPLYNFNAYVALVPFLTLGYLVAGWLYNLYEPEQLDSPWSVSAHVLSAVTLGTLLLIVLAFFGGAVTTAFSRWTIPLTWLFSLVFLLSWRLLFLRLGHIRWPEQCTVIVGLNDTALDLARSFEARRKWGWHFLGFITTGEQQKPREDFCREGYAVLGTEAELDALIEAKRINRVVVAEPAHLREFIESFVLNDYPRLTVDVVPELYETFIGHTDTIVGDIPLMRIVSGSAPRYYRISKRIVDFAAAVFLLLLSSPLTLLVALASFLTQGRPLLYQQQRVGRALKPFKVYKFRTMVHNAEASSGPVLASEDDPRITPLGRILRRFRIDELPQMLNILRGEMSFIGPRPERPAFVETYLREILGYRERFRIKPGLTGLAQINGGYATTPERKLKYDLMYLYHQSFAMDLQIVFETMKVVLTGKGAR